MAEALCVTPHPPQTAAGEQTLYRELHGDSDREVDELPLPRESGKCMQAEKKLKQPNSRTQVRGHFLAMLDDVLAQTKTYL